MDFHQLEVFISIAKHKSFSKAADAIFLTQPTLSAHIISLENELGTMLFNRGSKEVSLTPSGKIFYGYALHLVNLRETAIASLSTYMNKVEGRLELGVSTTPCDYIMPELIKAFNIEYPKVLFSMHEMASNHVVQRILDNDIEMGIVGTKPDQPKLEFLHLCDDKLVLITPNEGRFKEWPEQGVNLSLIKKENFIVRGKHSVTRKTFELALKEIGLNMNEINIVAESDSSESIKQSVRHGLGISIIPKKAANDYVQFGVIRAFELNGLEFGRSFYLVHHKKRALSPLATYFKSFVIDYFAKAEDAR